MMPLFQAGGACHVIELKLFMGLLDVKHVKQHTQRSKSREIEKKGVCRGKGANVEGHQKQ